MAQLLAFLGGFFSILLLHLTQVGLYFLLDKFGRHGMVPDDMMVLLLFGILQWVYVVPALLFAKHHLYWAMFWGMAACAALTQVAQLLVWVMFAGSSIAP